MTDNQVEILRHAQKNKFFGTTVKGQDGIDCERLFGMGYMTRRKAASWMGDDFIYYISQDGIIALQDHDDKKEMAEDRAFCAAMMND